MGLYRLCLCFALRIGLFETVTGRLSLNVSLVLTQPFGICYFFVFLLHFYLIVFDMSITMLMLVTLEAFHMRCLKSIFGIHWWYKITHVEICHKAADIDSVLILRRVYDEGVGLRSYELHALPMQRSCLCSKSRDISRPP